MRFLKELFCKHYYELVEEKYDKYDNDGKRILNQYGDYTKKSKCRLCGKEIGHY